jgi:hypothetical protein
MAHWTETSDDVVVQLLLRVGLPVTRRNYIELNWLGEVPEWGAELEAELPPELQRR